MNEQIAAVVEETAKFCDGFSLDTPDVRGLFSADGEYSYFYDGPLLRGFSSSGTSIGQFNFSKLPSLRTASDGTTETAPSILCVSPFNRVNVLVGLEDALGNGLLYLVNVGFGKVMRAFALPFGVTSIETIHGDSVCAELPYLSTELQSFSGVVACGTKAGQIYLVDMMLDNPVEITPPLQLHKVELDSENPLPDRKRLLANQHKVLCYSLACTDNPEYFRYISAGRQLLYETNHDDVYISSLKFLPQLGSLCVGYNFGSFQMWRMDILSLDYSSPYNARSLPVSHFTFLEPENDPRSFCYLWVAKCSSLASATALSDSMQEYIAGSVARAALYQLAYEERSSTVMGTPLFKNLMQVGCALQHQLAPAEDVVTSWVVSCDSLSNIKSLRSLEDDSQLDGFGTDTYLTMISWRVRYTDNSVSSHFALFDINRWYHAQMPKQIRWYEGWCSYFSQYSFDEAVGDRICVDLCIDRSTISCYKCPRLRKLEKFQYPSSLRFEVKVLLPSGVRSVQYNGVQKQSLFDVLESSVESVVDPSNAFQLLRSADLITINSVDLAAQRKAILTTLLLHTHVEYIVKCFDQFSASDNPPVTVEFMMGWLWERLEKVIHQFDTNCVSLYDCSGVGVDASLRQSLLASITQTTNIIIVLKYVCILEKRLPHLKLDAPKDKLAVAEARLLHMKLVWWCLNRGLLPETTEEMAAQAHSFSYPGTTLKRSYNSRHSELLVSSRTSNSELMIDLLAKNLGPELPSIIEQEGGRGLYPPPNIKALLDIFLLEGALSHKLQYFVYTMLDLMALVDVSVNDSISSHIRSLLAGIETGRDNSDLSSLVLTLWSLDHRQYEDVIVSLRQPGVKAHLTSDLLHQMLSRLLSLGEEKVALVMTSLVSTYSSYSINNDLLISVYLSNRMLSAAVDISRRSHPSLDDFSKILTKLSTSEISNLLCLRLTQPEFDCLSKHLEEKGDLDKLVVHHLQMGNLAEAVALNKALNSQPLWKGDLKAKEKAMTRDRLVKWQLSLLPPIQKKLLEDPKCLQLPSRAKTTQVKSLHKSFIFGTRDAKALAPMDIAQMVLESNTSIRHKPFIHNLTSSVKKPARSGALSALRNKSKSVTGLFDSPSLRNRSYNKRRAEYSDDVPAKRSASDESLISWNDVKHLLQTPLVNRKSPRSRLQASAPLATPHSILKIRKPQIKSSPRNLSGRMSATPKSSSINAGELMETVSKSSARVKFVMEEEYEQEIDVPPKTIDFTEEDDSLSDHEIKEPAESLMADGVEESEEGSEIEFNMSAPLTQVITGASALVEPMNDESFNSAFSDLAPSVVSNSEEQLAVSAQVSSNISQPPQHSPTGHRVSLNESLDDSLKSLSNLDTEAQLCGLELRKVRQAAIDQDKPFAFSPVVNLASPNVETKQEAVGEFTFTPPNVVHGELRRTRSMGTPSVTIEHRPIPKPAVEPPKSLVKSPESVVKSPKSVVKSPKTVVKSPKSVVKSPKSVVKSPKSVVKSSKSVVKSPKSVVKSPKSIVKSPKSVVTSSKSVVKSPEPVEYFTNVEKVVVKPSVLVEHTTGMTPRAVEQRSVADQLALEPLVTAEDKQSSVLEPVVKEVCWSVEKATAQTVSHLTASIESPHKYTSSSTVKSVTQVEVGVATPAKQKHDQLKESAQDFVFSPVTQVAKADAVLDQHSVQNEYTFCTPNVVRTEGRVTRSMRKSFQRPVVVESAPKELPVSSGIKETQQPAEAPKTASCAEVVEDVAMVMETESSDAQKETQDVEKETQNAEKETQNVEKETRNAEKETRNVEKETRNAEKETRNVEKETQNAGKETQNAEKETQNAGKETRNAEKDTRNAEKETRNPEKETQNAGKETRNAEKETQNAGKETRNAVKDTRNAEKETRNVEKETQNAEKETRNVEKETQNAEKETRNVEKETQNVAAEEKQEFAFSPVTQVAPPTTVDTDVFVTKEFTFSPPSSVTGRRSRQTKSVAPVETSHTDVINTRRSGRRKSVKPVNIKLPEEHKQESLSTRVLRTRSSTDKQKPVKPVVIPLPEAVFRKEPVASGTEEETTTSSAPKPRRGRPRKDSESSVESLPVTPARRGRPRKDSTKATQLLAAVPETGRLNLEVAKDEDLTSATKASPSRRGQRKKDSTASESKEKQTNTKRASSTKKAQKTSPDVRKSIRTRSSVKKPDLSPILPHGGESSSSAPRTRARRKL